MSDFTYYEVLGNVDQTEGRQGLTLKRAYMLEDDAVRWASSAEGRRHCGVMGHGDGHVVCVDLTMQEDRTLTFERTKIWGYRKASWKTAWDYGYVDFRDAPNQDPEYQEYVRLKARFDK